MTGLGDNINELGILISKYCSLRVSAIEIGANENKSGECSNIGFRNEFRNTDESIRSEEIAIHKSSKKLKLIQIAILAKEIVYLLLSKSRQTWKCCVD